jgi:hypothetical protein
LQEALEILNGQEETAAVLQLESQIYYRLARMTDCLNSYEKLQKISFSRLGKSLVYLILLFVTWLMGHDDVHYFELSTYVIWNIWSE